MQTFFHCFFTYAVSFFHAQFDVKKQNHACIKRDEKRFAFEYMNSALAIMEFHACETVVVSYIRIFFVPTHFTLYSWETFLYTSKYTFLIKRVIQTFQSKVVLALKKNNKNKR